MIILCNPASLKLRRTGPSSLKKLRRTGPSSPRLRRASPSSIGIATPDRPVFVKPTPGKQHEQRVVKYLNLNVVLQYTLPGLSIEVRHNVDGMSGGHGTYVNRSLGTRVYPEALGK